MQNFRFKIVSPLLWRERTEMSFSLLNPPVFFVQVELDDEHFYDRVKTKFVFRF